MSLIKTLKRVMDVEFGRDCMDDVPDGHLCFTDMPDTKMLLIPEDSLLYGYIGEILRHSYVEYRWPIHIKKPAHVSFYRLDMLTDSIELLKEINKEAISLKGGGK